MEIDGNHVRARVQRAGKAVPGLLSDLRDADIDLESIEVHRPTLDDVFLTLTGRSLRDAEATAPADPTSKEKLTCGSCASPSSSSAASCG